MTATHNDHIQLLESMAQLKEEWTDAIKQAITILDDLYDKKVEESVSTIVEYMVEVLSWGCRF